MDLGPFLRKASVTVKEGPSSLSRPRSPLPAPGKVASPHFPTLGRSPGFGGGYGTQRGGTDSRGAYILPRPPCWPSLLHLPPSPADPHALSSEPAIPCGLRPFVSEVLAASTLSPPSSVGHPVGDKVACVLCGRRGRGCWGLPRARAFVRFWPQSSRGDKYGSR